MLQIMPRLQRVAFKVGMLGVIGFGTVQAFAAPGAVAAGKASCTPEQHFECRTYCKQVLGGSGYICEDGRCYCF